MKNKFLYSGDVPDNFYTGDSVAVDTETMGLISGRDRLCVLQISAGDGNAHLVQFVGGDYTAPNLRRILSDDSILKIFHFARFDIATIYKHMGIIIRPCYCTKIASRLARTYTDYHGLKELCNELLGIRLNKQQQSSDWGRAVLSSEQVEYAASDVLFLHRIKDKLDSMLIREGRANLAQACFNFLETRIQLDLGGWPEDIFAHQ